MPTIQIDLIEVKERSGTNNVIITARQGNKVIVREIDRSEFDTWEKFAYWLINQEPEFIRLPEKENNLSIEYHTEIIEDETYKVVDSVTIL